MKFITWEKGRLIVIIESEGTIEYLSRVSVKDFTVQYRSLVFVHPDGCAVLMDALIEERGDARMNDMVIYTDEQKAKDAALAHVRDCRTFITG
jgi:hypothetical protein